MRLGIVARTLNVQHLRGTGRYVQELLRNTADSGDVHWTAYGHNPSAPFRVPSGWDGTAEVFDFRGDKFQLWEQLGLPWRVRRSGVQLLHCAENTVPIWQPVPTVVTIHDTVLWAEERPRWLERHYLQDVQGFALRRCAAVITISESSRRDIAHRWPALAERIRVVPHGIADEFFDTTRVAMPSGLEQSLGNAPYLLYLGGPQPRKRFAWALELLAHAGRNDLHLVACGFAAGTTSSQTIPQALQGRIHFAPFIEDSALVTLYRNAVAVLYPTLYEGFGFPAVEAQAAGTPVLFSPVSSLVALVGPLAWTAPAEDFPAWLAALRDVLSLPPQVRAELAVKGQDWARQFSWKRSVERHLEIFRDVLAK